MTDNGKCSQCGSDLSVDAPMGLCPKCLLKLGVATQGMTQAASGQPPEAGSSRPAFVPPSPQELAGSFPQLEILELLGQGGMGAVYKARQPGLDRLVALKILPPASGADPAFAERFAREARSLARLNHPNIVAVYDFGQAGRLFYFVMEFVDGVNLRQLEAKEPLSPKEALAIVPQICEALQYAHDEGIVHRDIKPENILMDKKGRVKIADFGLAKLLTRAAADYTLTDPRQVMGTVHYMAPEQVEHPADVDQRADIYSLGVVFYEMLTGELPLGRFQPPSQKVRVDVRLDEVVLRTLAREPELRYQQASQVRCDVEQITRVAGLPASPPPAAPGPATRPRLSRPAIVGALLAPLVLGAVGATVAMFVAVPHLAGDGPPAVHPWLAVLLGLAGLVGLTAPFATTILGIVAISQIRNSAGRVYGMGLAIVDALLFPLLILDGILIAAWALATAHAWYGPKAGILVGILTAIAVDVLIVWLVGRAVRRPARH